MPIVASELLKKARRIESATRRLVEDRLAGQYHSVFKGRGLVRAAILIPWAIPTIVSAKMWALSLIHISEPTRPY